MLEFIKKNSNMQSKNTMKIGQPQLQWSFQHTLQEDGTKRGQIHEEEE
jgi:hypothetical protein